MLSSQLQIGLILGACFLLTHGLAEDRVVGRDCSTRRGLGECRSLGDDCVLAEDGSPPEFPLKMHTVHFPCLEPFSSPPMVHVTIENNDSNNKLYASSLGNVTTSAFTVNVQRVEDVEDSNRLCSEYRVCYVAIQV